MPADSVAADSADYQLAVEMLRGGRLSEGSRLLGDIARRTRDDEVRSRCLFNLGEVLEKCGQTQQAYETWYILGHKPIAQRNGFDRQARARVMQMFDAAGLRLKPPDFPPRVQMEITNRCNLRCIMCTRNQMTRPLGDMSMDTFRAAADEVCTEAGCAVAMYFLGEPLLNPLLEEMVGYLADKAVPGLVFGIQTNGTLMTGERARGLLEAGLRSITFSLDGLSGDLERIRVGTEYAEIERNILGLVELGRQMSIRELIRAGEYSTLPACADCMSGRR